MKRIFCFFLLISSGLSAQELKGTAIRIIDGDTFTMVLEKDTIIIRLYGIDCPENKQPFSQEAERFLSTLILGKQLQLHKKGKDRYGRTIAIVTFNALNVNEELLKAGLAWHYKKYDKNLEWDKFEENARIEKIGLWSSSKPVAPWEWRNVKRKIN